jgi:hypothetical protein
VWAQALSHTAAKIIANIFIELILIDHPYLRFAEPNSSADRKKDIAFTINTKF